MLEIWLKTRNRAISIHYLEQLKISSAFGEALDTTHLRCKFGHLKKQNSLF
jgi:hypothetical protein